MNCGDWMIFYFLMVWCVPPAIAILNLANARLNLFVIDGRAIYIHPQGTALA